MALNKTKLEEYANKVYRGDFKRFKEKQKKDTSYSFNSFFREESKATKEKRVTTSSAQGGKVIDVCKRKCVICGKKYDEDPGDFQIHHVNGDRSHTIISNLVLLCLSHHNKVHRDAKAKLRDYKVKTTKRGSSKSDNVSVFGVPSLYSGISLFEGDTKKKGRKKKKDDDLWGF